MTSRCRGFRWRRVSRIGTVRKLAKGDIGISCSSRSSFFLWVVLPVLQALRDFGTSNSFFSIRSRKPTYAMLS